MSDLRRSGALPGAGASGSRVLSVADDAAPVYIVPDWPAPAAVRAMCTLRAGGVSGGPHGRAGGLGGGWNLGAACADNPVDVARNRARLREILPSEPVWLEQVHGCEVFDAAAPAGPARTAPPRADASMTTRQDVVLAVLTADCLPVLIADRASRVVGIAHAGWRGLAGGVIERTVQRMSEQVSVQGQWIAWLGPAIGPARFEVGEDVRRAFISVDPRAASQFVPVAAPGKFLADLYGLARQRLARAGVSDVFGGGLCTVSDEERFFSYRRDRVTGRMASLIWIDRG